MFVICTLFDDRYSDRCEVVSYCGFDLHFPGDRRYWAFFHVAVGHLYVFFGKTFIQVFCLLFNWVVFLILSWMRCSYIFDINLLTVIALAGIFSMKAKVTQSCPTLSDPMDCSLPGSSVHGIFQARVLEWGAIAFSKRIGYQLQYSWTSLLLSW